MTWPARQAGSAVLRAERTLARTMFFFRAGGIAEILAASSLDFSRYPSGRLGYVLGLIALVGVESAILVIVCLRAGRIRAGWVGLDVVFCTAGLVASAVLSAPSGFLTWANFMYPFTIITSFGIGAGVRRLPAVIGMTTVLAAGYFLSALLAHHDPLWNVLPDSLTYYANVVVAWAVARHLLAGGRELDDNRAEAVSRATELARERERARHARMLHDRVLQTLETLARGRWLDDPDFRTHIAGEAAWLRALVEGADPGQERDLLTALQLLVHRNIGLGLRVELNSSQLRDTDRWWRDLPADVVDAVVDATQEALTNVAKHSGVTTAVLRASTDGTHLAVSVLDHGCGFEPGTAHRGIGLDRSIRARMAELGGEARIESAPGAGTYVELVLPLNGSPAA